MRLLLAILTLALCVPGTLAEQDVSRLKLRGQTTVHGDVVTVADVVDFTQADPRLRESVGDEPVLADPHSQGQSVVTHAQLLQRLDELGVNLARVLVGGSAACQITLQKATPSDNAEQDALLRRPGPRSASGTETLADVLRSYVNSELAELGGTAELQFDRGGAEFLELTTPPWEFRVSGSGADPLGLREFRVVIRRDGRVQRTVHVFARVRVERQVVVARRPLSIGNFVRQDDVGLETRVFEDAAELGLGGVGEVVGQQVKRFVPSGGLIQSDALKSVDLVRRSRPVTVFGSGSNVQLRLTGMALDSGSYGDSVRVRLGDSRKTHQQLRGVVTGLGTVRLVEERP